MSTDGVLTIDDLDRLSSASFEADDPLSIAAQLVEAAEQERIADPADIGYAYLLAAEIHGDAADPATALALAERAVAAYERWASAERNAGAETGAQVDVGWPLAYRARMLFQLGREEDAMAELTALRPRLISDELAPSYLSETLEDIDRSEVAVEWLTGALDELRASHPEELPEELGNVVYHLAVTRHRIRRDLDLPPDDYDDVADQFLAVDDEAGSAPL
jgi:tetratricopeptide (TPR) repeat protein